MCCATLLLRSASVHVSCMHLHSRTASGLYSSVQCQCHPWVWEFYVHVQETSEGLLGLRSLLSISIGFSSAHIFKIVCQNRLEPVNPKRAYARSQAASLAQDCYFEAADMPLQTLHTWVL